MTEQQLNVLRKHEKYKTNILQIAFTQQNLFRIFSLTEYSTKTFGQNNFPFELIQHICSILIKLSQQYLPHVGIGLDSVNYIIDNIFYFNARAKKISLDLSNLKIKAIKIESGSYHSLILSSNGKVYGFGGNTYGQLGLGDLIPQDVPICIPDPIIWDQIACGFNFSAGISKNSVYCWGRNHHGQLGLGHKQNCYSIQKVPASFKVISISCGYTYCTVLTYDGIFGWGDNEFGQLGMLTNHISKHETVPIQIKIQGVYAICCGAFHTIAISDDGIFGFGRNQHFQLGVNTEGDFSIVPNKIELPIKKNVVR